ncbi:YsnF/AvaK domain-containing protein [Spirosoma radiotolerans]|uniref:DUF2382 domain-containing protein n=1 Tax=Spirosoma radiotolerans TaxID=1379870 RepID=A0A0E3ZU38_9BACT|nr:YsnF/AvaK domain-containing protein [Spirosoma radiotolerans]AKD54350.1 hypothetical protein SD10_04915 [Spirosoma radiotolerans]
MAQQTVIGVFDDASDAQRAVDQLISNGFSRDSIDLSAQTSSNYSDSTTTRVDRDDDDDHDSGIGGFFSSLFGSDSDESRKYSHVANRGSLVTVHAQSADEAERAADLLDEYGAVDVDERASEYGYANYNQSSNTPNSVEYGAASTGAATTGVGATGTGYGVTDDLTNTTDRLPTTDADQTIKVIEENLEVGKREVERGGVRVRSRIVERPVEESLRLREERVHVQRTPVNRPATADDLNAFQEGSIELVEHAEVPVVSKTANVVEEISVGKEVNERVETIRDTVRSTDVNFENLPSTDPLTQTNQTNRTIDLDDDANTSYTNR